MVRQHAVVCRDLQLRARQVFLRCGMNAKAVVEIIPDIRSAVLEVRRWPLSTRLVFPCCVVQCAWRFH
jgi:hypothetical protein